MSSVSSEEKYRKKVYRDNSYGNTNAEAEEIRTKNTSKPSTKTLDGISSIKTIVGQPTGSQAASPASKSKSSSKNILKNDMSSKKQAAKESEKSAPTKNKPKETIKNKSIKTKEK